MSETVMKTEAKTIDETSQSKWAWVPGVLFMPRSTTKKIVKDNKANWMIPLLILAVISILVIVAIAPIKRDEIRMGTDLPEGSEWWSEDQIMKYREAQQNMSSATFMYLFPTIIKLLGIWFNWMIFGSLLYLALTLAGSRAPRIKSSNLVAWAMLPLTFRHLIELILIFTRQQIPAGTALVTMIGETKSNWLLLAKGILSQIDAYWVWFVIILLIGSIPLAGIKRSKTIWVTLLVILIMLIIQGLPTLISSYLSGLSGSGFNIYF